VQTGPAMRGDDNILQDQLQQLQAEPTYQQIYQLLSQSIRLKATKKVKATKE
jgi:predicted lipoprotein